MCMIDDGDRAEFMTERWRTARAPHKCGECYRVIAPAERYLYVVGRVDDGWFACKVCRHCEQLCYLLTQECGGVVYGAVQEDIAAHAFQNVTWATLAARYTVAMRREWLRFDGRGLMALPTPPLNAPPPA